MKKYILYTDGACSGNPGPGWWWAVIIHEQKIISQLSGASEQTTNNKMELTWAIEGIKRICEEEKISIDTSFQLELFAVQNKYSDIQIDLYTDSIYVQKWITSYIQNWKVKWRKTSNRKPVANMELRVELDRLDSCLTIVRHRVKGHDWNKFNEMADKLATRYLN